MSFIAGPFIVFFYFKNCNIIFGNLNLLNDCFTLLKFVFYYYVVIL
ncbi:conserved hypothetical protein [Borreliella finlandensis]|uniref:Uncharacterized protein n=1 Tax=Borreliella finlandensis TaxID=498741 RepID=A0A826GS06_9SPIR|nr:conserved hypothetical protein [Borreliella finlandensis]